MTESTYIAGSRGFGAAPLPLAAPADAATLGDYLSLLKPRLMSLSVFTALAGMVAAPGHIHPVLGVAALLLIAVGAGACGALNMWFDADIDGAMQRTAKRPLPRGRVPLVEAASLGLVLAVVSVMVLGIITNWVAAGLLALTIAYYIPFYTMWLKRRTPQNIVIGGAAGAFPPAIGWAVTTGGVGWEPLVLFLIIFLWTPPHFWALALYRMRDFERAGLPMLPITHGKPTTRVQMLVYSALLLPVSLAPVPLGFAGPVYGVVAGLASAIFLWRTWRVFAHGDGPRADALAKSLFGFSILYLFLIFAVLLAEATMARAGFAL